MPFSARNISVFTDPGSRQDFQKLIFIEIVLNTAAGSF